MRLGINEALSEKGRRVTGARQALAELIGAQEGHFTAADLMFEARRRRVRLGRATVFRTLDLLAEIGALERLDLPSGGHAYVSCEPEQHHHHVVCRKCGKSAEVADSGLQSIVGELGRQSGFRIESHRLELYGLCPECAA